MNEADWNECLENRKSIKRSEDTRKANSLKRIALGRISFVKSTEIDKHNANYIFEMYYSSLCELTHALSLLKGFKILNHLCLGFFLRDFLKKEDMFKIFDDLRYKRNGLLYYGSEMDFEVAKEAIEKSKLLLEALLNTLD